METRAPRSLRRLAALLVVAVYAAGCATPCGLPTGAPEPASPPDAHTAAATHGADPDCGKGPLLRAKCGCGCERRPGAAGAVTAPGWALPSSAPTPAPPSLETRLAAPDPLGSGDRVDELDHVPIASLL